MNYVVEEVIINEDLKLEYGPLNIYYENVNSPFYRRLWDEGDYHFPYSSAPNITLKRDSVAENDYFKLEMFWAYSRHNAVTININNGKQIHNLQPYMNFQNVIIDSYNNGKTPIKFSKLEKINIGMYYEFNNTVLLNRTQEIRFVKQNPITKYFFKPDTALLFQTITQLSLYTRSYKPPGMYNPVYANILIQPLLLEEQGLWAKIANVSIWHDYENKPRYSNDLKKMELTNLVFGDKNSKLPLQYQTVNTNDSINSHQIIGQIIINEMTKYDYGRQNTYKSPNSDGKFGYYIPYNLKGDFVPEFNLTITSYFEDFKIYLPYNFKKPLLDLYDGNIKMDLEEDPLVPVGQFQNHLLISNDKFETIIKRNLTLDGIKNL